MSALMGYEKGGAALPSKLYFQCTNNANGSKIKLLISNKREIVI